ncbi:MAG: response regulator [Calditrichaeota bacterium]|nr:MAG: response regulator [Calditrichota bacterium]
MSKEYLEEDCTIVIVDDEPMITQSISNFLLLESEYNVETFNDPDEALEFLKENTADLIITDYLMPEMNGIDFLIEAMKIQPHTIRILLTGYADKENAIKAINEVGLFQYIEKPWDNDALKLVIRNGLDKRMLLKRLQDKIRDFESARSNLEDVQNEILKAFI